MGREDNPYKSMLLLYQKAAENTAIQQGIEIGTIVSPPPELKILWHGMTLDKRHFYIDEKWIPNQHHRAAKGHIISATQNRSGGGGEAAFASHNHDIDNDYIEAFIYTDTWKVGDKVAMLPVFDDNDKQQAQQFIIAMKLVRLDGE